jgi:hypothetical protein
MACSRRVKNSDTAEKAEVGVALDWDWVLLMVLKLLAP